MPNGLSFRVVKSTEHRLLLERVHWFYSSSANLSGEEYSETYARDNTEVIVTLPKSKNSKASTIYRLGEKNMKVIR